MANTKSTISVLGQLFSIITVIINFLQADPLNKSRVEDALIAWTWKKYLDTNGTDPKVLLRFPMTKVTINKTDYNICVSLCLVY